MSRKEVVLLVSRALAIIQFVAALEGITYLPERLLSYFHHAKAESVLSPSMTDPYFHLYDQLAVGTLFVRIIGLLILTYIFWNCAPWFERQLLPTNDEASLTSEPESPAQQSE